MPGIMFQDVVSPRERSNRKWYTLPLSFVVHTVVLAVLIAVPLIATTDFLPAPRAMLEFVTPFVPVVPSPPPILRAASAPAAHSTGGAPVVAPDTIGVESGVIFEPGDVATGGIETITDAIGVGQLTVDAPPPVAPVPVRTRPHWRQHQGADADEVTCPRSIPRSRGPRGLKGSSSSKRSSAPMGRSSRCAWYARNRSSMKLRSRRSGRGNTRRRY